tara:strand:- start:73 stop:1059 length:987 start_codon:yes stop_codon:yes gene_type:complete
VIGGGSAIVVQSMTNTETSEIEATTQQIQALAAAGSELVRITVNTEAAAAAVPEIRARLNRHGCQVPLVGDFHFNGHKLLENHPECAKALAKYRINPGNVGRGSKHDSQFAQMIDCARRHNKPIRIGVNWGSLDPALLAQLLDENAARAEPRELDEVTRDALVESALQSALFAEHQGLQHDQIVLSCKVSSVPELIRVYRELATRTDLPLHLGLTEAGMGDKGVVSSTAALAILLGRDWRHHPRVVDPGTGRRSNPRGAYRAGNSAKHGASIIYAAGGGVSRLWPHQQRILSTIGRRSGRAYTPANADLETPLSRGRKHDRGRDGVCR